MLGHCCSGNASLWNFPSFINAYLQLCMPTIARDFGDYFRFLEFIDSIYSLLIPVIINIKVLPSTSWKYKQFLHDRFFPVNKWMHSIKNLTKTPWIQIAQKTWKISIGLQEKTLYTNLLLCTSLFKLCNTISLRWWCGKCHVAFPHYPWPSFFFSIHKFISNVNERFGAVT